MSKNNNDGAHEIEEEIMPGERLEGGEWLSLLLEVDDPKPIVETPTEEAATVEAVVAQERQPSTHKRRPYAKELYVDLMSDEERRAYNTERQRERRANIKRRKEELNAVTFNVESAREALADAALMILASNAAGSDAIRTYLAAVYRTQLGAPMTLESWIGGGTLKPKLLKYTRPPKT